MKPTTTQNRSVSKTKRHWAAKLRRQRGIALLMTLLLLSLVSLLGLAMVLGVNSDMLINGYYGNYRGSFYAADSGLNIARQSVLNSMQASVSTTPCVAWGAGAGTGCTSDPLSSFNGTTVMSNLKTTYGSFSSVNSSGSWPGSFAIVNNDTSCNQVTAVTGSPAVGSTYTDTANPSDPLNGLPDSYTYTYNYTICSTGRAQSLQQVLVKESGSFIINVQAQTAGSPPKPTSFAAFGAFIDNFSSCQGPLVYGTVSGPMFTNGSWNWGSGGSYIYTDPVGQHGANASYWFGSTCKQSSAPSYTYNKQTIKPTFQQGFTPGASQAPLPSNDFSQKWAVLDGKGCGEGGTTCGSSTPPSPTNSDLNQYLKNINGTSYPTTGTTSGVYLPYCTGSGCANPNTVNGGGIYVEGSAAISLSIGNDGASPTPHLTQTYTIVQGSTTTKITTNIGANTTTVVSGSKTLNLTGVPQNLTGSTPSPATMLYVNGTVTGLTGPGQGQAGIQDYSQITISAASDINVTGDLVYAHKPVDTSDNLIANSDFNQTLGLFTSNGNIVLKSPYSNGNLETDASLAAINVTCPGGSSSCGFATTGSGHTSCGGYQVCTWTIIGGRIESSAHGVSIQQANTYFDRRYTTRAGFAPPWFPSTTIDGSAGITALAPKITVSQPQRLSWVSYPQ
jgi:Tfp pilus assembly protein PilX